MKKSDETSWGSSSDWYSQYLEEGEDTYQRQVILPNLVRLLSPREGMQVLDIACGQGFFSREIARRGAQVTGADISPELIEEAKRLSDSPVTYHVASADALSFARDESYETAVMVLAIQNIENMAGVFSEANRVLTPEGRLLLVMMHPAFRIPGEAHWGYDEEKNIQYRRVDRYLSPLRTKLLVHPGKKNSPVTISYHRSLQDFSKALFKTGFTISRFEEWNSHKESEPGPRKHAEDAARKEIPLFLMIEATKK